ncbi:20384_t:CDS:1, partial [Gigaspora rosea]
FTEFSHAVSKLLLIWFTKYYVCINKEPKKGKLMVGASSQSHVKH